MGKKITLVINQSQAQAILSNVSRGSITIKGKDFNTIMSDKPMKKGKYQ